MKCRRCHCTMEKDYDFRLATCPECGRTVSYRSKADKKRGYRYYPEYDDTYISDSSSDETISPFYWFLGSIVFWGIIILFVAIVFGILFLAGVFKNGFWVGLGDIAMFFVNLVWSVICFIGRTIWGFLSWLFHLIFG